MHSRRFEREHLQVKSKQRVPVGEDAQKAYGVQYRLKSEFFLDPQKSQSYKNSSWYQLDAIPSKTLKMIVDKKILENDIKSVETVKGHLANERRCAEKRLSSIQDRREHLRCTFRRRKALNDTLEQRAGVIKMSVIPPKSQTPDTEVVARLKTPKGERVVRGRALPSECTGMISTTYDTVMKRVMDTPVPVISRESPEPFPISEALRRSYRRSPISLTPVPHSAIDPPPKTRVSVNSRIDMERELRYIHNRFPDYEQGIKAGGSVVALQEQVRAILRAKSALLLQKNPPTTSMEIGVSPNSTKPGFRVYTACGGNIVAYGKLGAEQANSNSSSEQTSENALTAVRAALRLCQNMPSRVSSFYMGAAGIYALAAVTDAVNWQTHVEHLAGEWTPAKVEDDEVLFGKAGYLYCLLYVQSRSVEGGQQLRGLIEEVAETLFESGLKQDRRLLAYSWRGRDYLGAAHGLVGILHVLVLCLRANETWIFRQRNTFNDYREVLERSLDYLCDLQYPSGNFPAHVKDAGNPQYDKLVHFCHGAPGAVLTLCEAYKYFNNQRFLATAIRSGDMIWERGLLKKGNGLCHGIAGNGYSFLSLYRATHSEKWLWRALQFAHATDTQWVQEEVARWRDPQRDAVGVPDTPFSLMEGLGGTVCFLIDVLQPEASRFPGFEL